MIPIPRDYDTARAYDGNSAPALAPGGHICRILGVRMEKTRNTDKDMLVAAFDIAEGSEFDGYYKARHERSSAYNKDAKWPGVFRVTLTNADGSTSGWFKGFIKAVEESNAGYDFKKTNGDEQALKGKLVGFNFGEEEYEFTDRQSGEIRGAVSVKPVYAVSIDRVREGIEPPAKKLLNGTRASAQASARNYGMEEVEDPDLPF